MCGIAGIFNPSSDAVAARETAAAMGAAIAYRGPDGAGVWSDGYVALAHRRLAIIDLDAAAGQPMCDAENRAVIVFNGEIYNFPTLRAELAATGVRFRTRSDTEVILELYKRFGTAAIARLDGMFALAIYDLHTHTLLLARDRLGKKPLFYFQHGRELVFASELGALKRHPAMPRELACGAIHDYLAFEYVPGTDTVYRDVKRLAPASLAVLRAGETTLRHECYWRLDYSVKPPIGFDDAAARLRELLVAAVRKRLIADVPCGVFLSGGTDSGIVAALAAQWSDRPLSTYTIGFNEASYDERAAAQCTAEYIRKPGQAPMVNHFELVDSRNFDLLTALARHYGEPFADFSLLPTALLSRFTAAHVKVALSGDGGDEIFGGYERYQVMTLARRLAWLPPGAPQLLRALAAGGCDGGKRSFTGRWRRFWTVVATPEKRRYFQLLATAGEAERRRLYGERLRDAELPDSARIIQAAELAATARGAEKYAEIDLHTYLSNDILVKVDIAAMAAGLEVRSPLLDTAVIEFAARLPFEFKQSGAARKRILKAACADLLAPEVAHDRRKRGFAIPAGAWFRGAWRRQLEEYLLEGAAVRSGWLAKPAVARLLAEHQREGKDRTEILSALLMLAIFLEQER